MGDWIKFDECFDEYDGGALYVREGDDDDCYAAGALWMDGGEDGKHYFAFIARFYYGEERDGVKVSEPYDAADMFSQSVDGDVVREICWADTMDEAVYEVGEFVKFDTFEY